MTKLTVDVLGPGDRARDFSAEKFAETLAEPVQSHFHGAFRQIQSPADFRQRSRTFFAPDKTLQLFEEGRFVRCGVFMSQAGQHLLDQGDGLPSLVGVIWIGFIHRLPGVTLLSLIGVKRK